MKNANVAQPWSLPNSWMWSTMGEIADVIGGGTPRTDNSSHFENGNIPWITPADLSGYKAKYISKGARNITQIGLENSGARLMPTGTVLFSSRAPIGYVAIAANPVTTNQGFKSFALKEGICPDYIYYYLQQARELARSFASGTTFLEISSAKAALIPAPIAPLPEQTRIVAEIEKQLTRLDDAVAALKRVQANLKRYRASVLKAACEGRLVPTEAELARKEGRTYEPASELLKRILAERRAKWETDQLQKMITSNKPPKDNEWKKKYNEPAPPDISNLPTLPQGWTWATIEQLSVVVRGASPRPAGHPKYFGGSIPWITVGSLTSDESLFLRQVSEFVTEAGKAASRYIEPDTLLLTNSGATLGVPKITLIGGCINDGSVALLNLSNPLKTYLYYFLSSLTKKLRSINQGAAQPNLNTRIVNQITVPLPPISEQSRIVAATQHQFSVYDSVSPSLSKLQKMVSTLRSSLLMHAFSGALVPQNPNDEPASVLLERIRAERANSAPNAKKSRNGAGTLSDTSPGEKTGEKSPGASSDGRKPQRHKSLS